MSNSAPVPSPTLALIAADLAADRAAPSPSSVEGCLARSADLLDERLASCSQPDQALDAARTMVQGVWSCLRLCRDVGISESRVAEALAGDMGHDAVHALGLAETFLAEWLTDNTEDVFEEEPEVDDARTLIQDAQERLSVSLKPIPPRSAP